MLRLGLKVWSTNRAYVEPARRLHAAGAFDFLEMAVPEESPPADVALWKDEPYPFVLHAPHAYSGLNMAVAALEPKNRAQMERLDEARRLLAPALVIFHPGVEGSLEETIRQIGVFRAAYPDLFAKAVVENKPRVGLAGETCRGAAPEEVRRVLDATGLGFCLDVPHAICYANWARRPWQAVAEEFLAMGPAMFHVADGDARALTDAHEHLGAGTMDLRRVFEMLPPDARVTLETRKDFPDRLDDFLADVDYVRACVA